MGEAHILLKFTFFLSLDFDFSVKYTILIQNLYKLCFFRYGFYNLYVFVLDFCSLYYKSFYLC